jgi:hypothetical protein
MLSFSLKIIVTLHIKGRPGAFTDSNNEYQLRDFKAVAEPTNEQQHKQRNTCLEKFLIVCQCQSSSCRRQWVMVEGGLCG